MCDIKLITGIYMDLEAGGSYSGLEGFQGGRGYDGSNTLLTSKRSKIA